MANDEHWKTALREHPHLCAGITDICDNCEFSRGDAVHMGPTNHHRFSKFGFTLVREDLPVGDKAVSKEIGLYRKEQCLARFIWAPKAKILYAHPGVSLVVNRDRSHNPQIGLYRADAFGGPRGTPSRIRTSSSWYFRPQRYRGHTQRGTFARYLASVAVLQSKPCRRSPTERRRRAVARRAGQ